MSDKNKTGGNSRVADTRTANSPAPRPTRTPAPAGPSDPRRDTPACPQLAAFEAAMKLFHARRFAEARLAFQQASTGAERDVAQRSQLHIAMCDRRLERTAVTLTTAEEYYTYGVAMLNTRNVLEARAHLEKALSLAPHTDHIHYALALAQALSGDLPGAQENLRRAIELEPRNRMLARQDADFAPLANQAPFRALLYPDKKPW